MKWVLPMNACGTPQGRGVRVKSPGRPERAVNNEVLRCTQHWEQSFITECSVGTEGVERMNSSHFLRHPRVPTR